MATMVKLLREKDEIIEESYRRTNEAEERRAIEFQAVLKIQSWFRGQRVRSYIKHVNQCAVAVQRRWRGFLGRRYHREVLKKHVFIMKLNHYNAMATLVQKSWRGYYTRKYVSNYYSRKRYLEGLKIKNEIIRNELDEYAEQQEQMAEIKREREEKAKLDEYTRKNHYLLSTEVIPGVFNSPFKAFPDEMEFHLRNASMQSPSPKPPTKAKDKKSKLYDPGWRRYDLPKLEPLPLVAHKPQGPFREPDDVQKQRYKPFQPTLRVETNFYSLEEARDKMKQEEWVTRLIDTPFLPFKRKTHDYDALLHTTSSYGHLPYGTSFFRHEYPDAWMHGSNKRFQTLVPPIPILEKLNDTYSQGQV